MDFVFSTEKRQSSRIKLNSPLMITTKQDRFPVTAVCLDLSHSGLSVIAPTQWPIGTAVEVRLVNPLGLAPFQAQAEVVWVKPTSSVDKFYVGLSLVAEAETEI